jgi:sigma-B regulation protein RsbU (phosphoserine phosphatase)
MKQSISKDVATIGRIGAVPSILEVVSETTGLRFVTIARVTDDSWTALAVLDKINFGLKVGGDLDVATTLCSEVRDSRKPVIIDKASTDAQYCAHRTPQMYGFESYIAVPIFKVNGEYFGNLCALDPLPAELSSARILKTMRLFTELISLQLDAEERHGEDRAALLSERETAELREQFIAVLGHDLRTPLSSITMGAELLRRRPLDTETISIVERIRTSCRRISSLVDDVLDFARGRLGGGVPLDLREVLGLEEDLQHVVAELESAYPNRVIQCELDIRGAVFCDRSRVAQLLSNLLANALTHGASDVPVGVSAHSSDGSFVLSVTNQGRPIPPDMIPRLFQPYWRPANTALQGGLGLGLYIAAAIARSHGGTMDVLSSAEAGTTFTFTLPTRRI